MWAEKKFGGLTDAELSQRLGALGNGIQSVPSSDTDIVEAILFCSSLCLEVSTFAGMLLTHFGSYLNLVSATHEELLKIGLDERTAVTFKLVHLASQRVLRKKIADLPLLSNNKDLKNYLMSVTAYEKNEQVRVFFLDSRNFLLSDECHSYGTIDHAPIYPREIIRRAIDLDSTAIILVHNHPSHDLVPSEDDIAVTVALKKIGKFLSITLHDHLIVGRSGIISLNELGLI